MRTWTVRRLPCYACAVLEAEMGNDVEAGSRLGMKYAVLRG